MLKNFQYILIVIIGIGILTGCGKSMTNDEAENIIKKWYPQKSDAYAITFLIGVNRVGINDDLLRQLDELKKKGLIDYQPTGIRQTDPNFKDIVIQVTDKGKPYLEDSASSSGLKMFLLLLENSYPR